MPVERRPLVGKPEEIFADRSCQFDPKPTSTKSKVETAEWVQSVHLSGTVARN
jgi:hypothetical protein